MHYNIILNNQVYFKYISLFIQYRIKNGLYFNTFQLHRYLLDLCW